MNLTFCVLTDQELRNVIDKLAQFVARNGPEFEKMTMEKQKDNPKFSFLFGGEYFGYYKYKLAIEQQQRTYTEVFLIYLFAVVWLGRIQSKLVVTFIKAYIEQGLILCSEL